VQDIAGSHFRRSDSRAAGLQHVGRNSVSFESFDGDTARTCILAARGRRRIRLESPRMSEMPRATGVVVSITALVTGLQWIVPGLPQLLQRSPAVLASGEWWRLITAILINRADSAELIVNLVALLAVGVLVERCWGTRRWLLFYFVGGLIGEGAGLAWRPTGMGSSVAVCGLLGALAPWLLIRATSARARIAAAAVILVGIGLTALRNLHGPPLLACACIGGVMLWKGRGAS
jgi:rhomboid protease GluP